MPAAPAPAPRLLLTDDHDIFRRGLRDVIVDAWPRAAIVEATDARSALAAVHGAVQFDAVVLDVSLPDRSGFDLLPDLRKARPRLPVLMLSAHPEEQYAVRVLKAGAAGYLSKARAAEEVVAALRRLLEGGRYVTPAVAEQLAAAAGPEGGGRPAHEALSDREFQVFRQLALGQPVKEIAASLGLSAPTVSTYRGRILEKLGLQSNAELMRYGLQHGLVE